MKYSKQITVEDYIDLGLSSDPVHQEGRVFYDPNEHALVVLNDEAEIKQQLGQEFYIRVYNNSGATIVDSKPVYITGSEASENRPTIALSRSDSAITAQVIGITTHTIENNSFGYVITKGIINDVDTSSFTSGSKLFVDNVVAGEYRTTEPPDGNQIAFIGYVIKSHATEGKILVTSAGGRPVKSPTGAASGALRFSNFASPAPCDLSTNVWKKIAAFNTKKDSGADYVSGDITTNYRLTIGAKGSGTYLATFHSSLISSGNGTSSIAIAKNGVIVDSTISQASVINNNRYTLSGSDDFDLVSGDYLELFIRANSDIVDPSISSVTLTLNRITGGSAGEIGPSGADGDLTWEGTWVAQNYTANQAVYYTPTGQSYVCKLNTTSSQDPTNTTYWDLLAKKGDLGTPKDQGVIQGERSTTYVLTATPTNLSFDLTGIENDVTVMEHDDVNRERVYIRESSYFLGILSGEITNSAAADRIVTIRAYLNDSVLLSSVNIGVDKTASEVFCRPLILPNTLPEGGYITLRFSADAQGDVTLESGCRIVLIQLKGFKGDVGPAGADGDMTWEGTWTTQNYTANQAVYYTPTGQSYVCKLNTTSNQDPTNTTYWDLLAKKGDTGPQGSTDIRLGYAEGSAITTSLTYAVVSSFVFRGSVVAGTPTAIKALVARSGGTAGNIRIFDVTNGTVIAELLAFNGNPKAYVDLGTISNIPTGEAVWEIQMQRIGGGGSTSVQCHSMDILF